MRFKKFFDYLFGKQIVYKPEPELPEPQIYLSYQQTNLWDTEENLNKRFFKITDNLESTFPIRNRYNNILINL